MIVIFLLLCAGLILYKLFPGTSGKTRFLTGAFLGAICGVILGFPVAWLLFLILSPTTGMPSGWEGTLDTMAFNALWIMMGLLFSIFGVFLGLLIAKRSAIQAGEEKPSFENYLPVEKGDKNK
ncbi:MAG: hypothetical protein J7M18_06265 [Candidatus Eremiobacteraeota bacterium]|nr:hypothetical protein [Candidatus Eremiobacteraeota bacterium]